MRYGVYLALQYAVYYIRFSFRFLLTNPSQNGPLNLFTIRNDPGKVHHVFRGHSGPVAAMCLQSDETGVLSAGWDGQAIVSFTASTYLITWS